MRGVPQISSVSDWIFDATRPAPARTRPADRTPPSRTPAMIAKMWMIAGPQGLSVDSAKAVLGIHPGPQDLVIYSEQKSKYGAALAPYLISCQPYHH
jgi:hypothetical protein